MLKPKQMRCLEFMIRGNMTDKEIAKAINVSQKTICDGKRKIQSSKMNTMR